MIILSGTGEVSAGAAVVGQVLLYTGAGGSQSISGSDISPDLVICKRRIGIGGTAWPCFDSVRGTTKRILTDATQNETTDTGGVTSFNANGFTVGGGSQYNETGVDYMSIVIEMVANAFDIVTYVGTGVAHAINHNLGVVPELIIIKNRTDGGRNWAVYPGPLSSPETKRLLLNTNSAVATSSTHWSNTAPSSTQFTVGTSIETNSNTHNHVAYLFASLNPGVKVGSYTGDGNTNGPAVTTGFRPKFVIIKRTDSTGDWAVFDDQRDPTSPHNTFNHLNISGAVAESVTTNTAGGVDFQATGFQSIDSAAADININGATYIYLAIA